MSEKDEVDLVKWEYMVATAEPDVRTPWHTVNHSETKAQKCWADGFYPDGSVHSCFENATTSLGLCAEHYKELMGSDKARARLGEPGGDYAGLREATPGA